MGKILNTQELHITTNMKGLDDLFTLQEVISFNNLYEGNSVGASERLKGVLLAGGYMATVILFKSDNGIFKHYNYRKKAEADCAYHAVVWCGEFVIDMLNSNEFILTKEYIDKLEEMNGTVMRIDCTSNAIDKKGKVFCPDIQWLKKYKRG